MSCSGKKMDCTITRSSKEYASSNLLSLNGLVNISFKRMHGHDWTEKEGENGAKAWGQESSMYREH